MKHLLEFLALVLFAASVWCDCRKPSSPKLALGLAYLAITVLFNSASLRP